MTQKPSPQKIIIDTDPGVDDVIALLIAMADKELLDILGITTVAGNVTVDKTSRNARLARDWADRPDIPVYAGASEPVMREPIYAADIHGNEGLSGIKIDTPKYPLAEGHAVNFIIDTLLKAEPNSVSIAMLGPQTNMALALKLAPEIKQGIKEIVLMGGSHFSSGNMSPVAEFNIFADPDAAKIVIQSGVPITYIPLDVTGKVLTSDSRIKAITDLKNKAGQIVVDILKQYITHDMKAYHLSGGPIHDANVIAYLLRPDLYTGKKVYVDVDHRPGISQGQTLVDWRNKLKQAANVNWVYDAKDQEIFDLFNRQLGLLK